MSALRQTSPQQPAPRAGSKTMSIGVVLNRLREEFPDVTVSKIRFLESEGLITPQRTASGYRRFTDDDVDRLRYILVTQRDNYLPLKVIREQLESMDSGQVTALVSVSSGEPIVSPGTLRPSAATRLSDLDVADQARAEVDTVDELIKAGLITPDPAGFFTSDDVRTVTTALALMEFGLDIRHLKTIRTGAARQAALVGQVTGPVARSGKSGAPQQAEELGRQLTALVASLHTSVMKAELRGQLGQ